MRLLLIEKWSPNAFENCATAARNVRENSHVRFLFQKNAYLSVKHLSGHLREGCWGLLVIFESLLGLTILLFLQQQCSAGDVCLHGMFHGMFMRIPW